MHNYIAWPALEISMQDAIAICIYENKWLIYSEL